MERTPAGWTVIDRDKAVLAYTYPFSRNATSTMFTARMANGELLAVSPGVSMPEAAFAELAAFGTVGALVANNGFHHLGQAEWKRRFPNARCFAPPEAIARLKKKCSEAGAFESLHELAALTGPDIGFRVVPNTKAGESWFWARTARGHAWYASDMLANMPALPPFPVSLLFKWTKSAPGFRVFGLAMKMLIKDKASTLRLLLGDLKAAPPSVIVPAHGDVLDRPGLPEDAQALIESALR